MPEKATVGYSVRITNGPSVGHTQEIPLDGYEKLSFSLANGESKAVDVLPAGVKAALVVVAATPADAKITYQPEAGAPRGLDGPLVLIGSGAAGLLGDPFPKLTLKNESGGPGQIDVFVGRVG